ncbi:alpha/beta hydrolase [Sphingomonas sp. MMS12-HWE2-04]|uniref:alpha/beta hydrolase n=1 Tax=Sphingomonas sp. MMS12-HWE2-04 TaxID=3234199 RepID=UPI00384CA6B4
MGRIVWIALAVAIGLYLTVLLAFAIQQRSLLYPAPPAPRGAATDMPPGFAAVALSTEDGLTLHAAYRTAAPGMLTLVFLHGNGSQIEASARATALLGARGHGVLLVEYRGYRGNPGKPSEAGLYADGRAALAWLRAQGVAPAQTVLIGNSLGSGVASQLAVETPVAGLVLISAFTSLPDVAVAHYPWLPARLLLRDRYDNRAKVARIRAPLLVLHGTADTVVPDGQGRTLVAAAHRATLELVPGAGHELAFMPETQLRIAKWLAAIGFDQAPAGSDKAAPSQSGISASPSASTRRSSTISPSSG